MSQEPFEKGFLEWFRSEFPYSWLPADAGMTGLGAHRHSRQAGIHGPFVPENHFCKGLLKERAIVSKVKGIVVDRWRQGDILQSRYTIP